MKTPYTVVTLPHTIAILHFVWNRSVYLRCILRYFFSFKIRSTYSPFNLETMFTNVGSLLPRERSSTNYAVLTSTRHTMYVDIIYVKYIVNNGFIRSWSCNWTSFLVYTRAMPTSSAVGGTEQAAEPSNFVGTQIYLVSFNKHIHTWYHTIPLWSDNHRIHRLITFLKQHTMLSWLNLNYSNKR